MVERRLKSRVAAKRAAVALLLLLLITSASLWLGGCASTVLLRPSTGAISTKAARRTLPFGGGQLEVFITTHGRPRAIVIELGGNAERAEYGSSLPWSDVEIWRPNWPGFGGSSGPARIDRLAESAQRVYDAALAEARGLPILVAGNSIGTTAALHLAATRPVAAVVLRNPPPLRRLISIHYGWWNLFLPALAIAAQVPPALDSVENAGRSSAPSLFILSGHDHVVPYSYQRRVADAYAGPRRELVRPEKGHNDPLSAQESAWVSAELERLIRGRGEDLQPKGLGPR